jgi:hypothetical protein
VFFYQVDVYRSDFTLREKPVKKLPEKKLTWLKNSTVCDSGLM